VSAHNPTICCFGAALFLALACAAPPPPPTPLEPGSFRATLPERAGGRERSYRVYVPAGAGTNPPLLVALHGGLSSARTLESRSGLNAAADRAGFVVVYPSGEGALGMLQHWNAGHCCGPAARRGRDDVGFVRRVIEDAIPRFGIDPSRVFLTGFSNGGMLAWRVAAEHPDLVTAVAPISATAFDASETGAGTGVPLILFHGAADPRIPASDVEASLSAWAAASGCRPEPDERFLREGLLRRHEWRGCDAGAPVIAYRLSDFGHRWPGPYFTGTRKDALTGFDSVEIMLRFFDSVASDRS